MDALRPFCFQPPKVKSSSWDSCGSIPFTHPSIWSKSPIKRKPETPSLLNPGRLSTVGKNAVLAVPVFKKMAKTGKQPYYIDSVFTTLLLLILFTLVM